MGKGGHWRSKSSWFSTVIVQQMLMAGNKGPAPPSSGWLSPTSLQLGSTQSFSPPTSLPQFHSVW